MTSFHQAMVLCGASPLRQTRSPRLCAQETPRNIQSQNLVLTTVLMLLGVHALIRRVWHPQRGLDLLPKCA